MISGNAPLLRVVLDEAMFRRLVAGHVVTCDDKRLGRKVDVILADIGWARMVRAVLDGMKAHNPPDPPEAREFLPRRKHGKPGK